MLLSKPVEADTLFRAFNTIRLNRETFCNFNAKLQIVNEFALNDSVEHVEEHHDSNRNVDVPSGDDYDELERVDQDPHRGERLACDKAYDYFYDNHSCSSIGGCLCNVEPLLKVLLVKLRLQGHLLAFLTFIELFQRLRVREHLRQDDSQVEYVWLKNVTRDGSRVRKVCFYLYCSFSGPQQAELLDRLVQILVLVIVAHNHLENILYVELAFEYARLIAGLLGGPDRRL